jgi:predicted short-subunit dehydrogenase-like oxidoreductase (DUF2520 family)
MKRSIRSSVDHLGIAIVGPGRVGQAMGRLLNRAGFRVRFVAARRISAARQAARFIGSGQVVTLEDADLAQARIFLLTTSDAAIAPVAARLAAAVGDWKGKVALHTCGSIPSSVLAPLKEKGAAIGSLHPFQTVPNPPEGVRNLRECFWALEGNPAARRVAAGWVKALGGVTFAVWPDKKIIYHAAAFLVCPTLVTLMDRSAFLLRQCGVPEKVSRPMLTNFVEETARNVARFGAKGSLTGPAVRGDWETIRKHLESLRHTAPEVVPAYKEILRLMLRLAGKKPPRDLQ